MSDNITDLEMPKSRYISFYLGKLIELLLYIATKFIIIFIAVLILMMPLYFYAKVMVRVTCGSIPGFYCESRG